MKYFNPFRGSGFILQMKSSSGFTCVEKSTRSLWGLIISSSKSIFTSTTPGIFRVCSLAGHYLNISVYFVLQYLWPSPRSILWFFSQYHELSLIQYGFHCIRFWKDLLGNCFQLGFHIIEVDYSKTRSILGNFPPFVLDLYTTDQFVKNRFAVPN